MSSSSTGSSSSSSTILVLLCWHAKLTFFFGCVGFGCVSLVVDEADTTIHSFAQIHTLAFHTSYQRMSGLINEHVYDQECSRI